MDYIMTLESYLIEDSTTDSAMESFGDKAREIFSKIRALIKRFITWIKDKFFSRKKNASKKKDTDEVDPNNPQGNARSKEGAAQERLNKEAQQHVSTTVNALAGYIDDACTAVNQYMSALLDPLAMDTPTGADEVSTLSDIISEAKEYAENRRSEYEDKYGTASLSDIEPKLQSDMKELLNKLDNLDRTLAFVIRSYQSIISVPKVQSAANQLGAKISELVTLAQRTLSYYELKI